VKFFVAVGALIMDGGKILLGKHVPERKGFWQGKWICPGGRLELGETIQEGVLREVMEETGLEVELVEFLLTFDRIFEDSGVKNHVVYIDYLAKVKGGSLKAASDLGIARWFQRAELDKVLDEVHEDTKVLLERAGLMDQ
jgi:ADP-ribose pyrophosphatase YjhB (NUDIX family)